MSNCPAQHELEEHAAGALPDDECRHIETHLLDCEHCRQAIANCREDAGLIAKLRSAWVSVDGVAGRDSYRTESLGPAGLTSLMDGSFGSKPGPASPDPSLLSKDAIPGYRIIREIHRGGQGVVYEAIQLSTRRNVAIKVLLEGPFASERSRWRFDREVKLVAALRHPHIVVIHDSGVCKGRNYFAMDYVKGMPLDAYVQFKRPDVRGTIGFFVQVCDAVDYAHRRGVIHRDLKPSNILMRDDDAPCVLDFGLAKVTSEELADSQPGFVTLDGQVMGTLQYMAPEQTLGDSDAIDTRTDVYALGLILYELLALRPAYTIDRNDLSKAFETIRNVDPPRPSKHRDTVNSEIDAIVLKAVEKDPRRRYQSVSELKQDLQAWLDGLPVSARSASSFYVLRKLAARHYFHTSVIVALLAAIIGFGGIAFNALLGERRANEELVSTNRDFQTLNADLTNKLDLSRVEIDKAMIGWFLHEWHGGRVEAAEEIRQKLRPGTPAREAIEFLLDDQRSPAELLAVLPEGPQASALTLFLTGERHLRHGRTAEAAAAYRQYAAEYKGFWLPLAQARLNQLAGHDGHAASRGPDGQAR